MTAKKLITSITLLITMSMLNADWSPEYLPLENKASIKDLNHPDLIKLENRVFNYLENSWCSQEKAQLIFDLVVLTRPSISVEIGAFTGSSTLPILTALRYLGVGKAYVVDAWSNYEASKGLPPKECNAVWWSQVDMGSAKRQFMRMLGSWSVKPYTQVLSISSKQAVSKIPKIDFLHLDGSYSETGALLDSQLYVPKVTKGGYILFSSALIMIGGKPTRVKALWPLFEQCDMICEIENGNALLFKKR